MKDGLFDGALVAFGIRNVGDPVKAMREVLRVLRPGGRFVVLEFSTPGACSGWPTASTPGACCPGSEGW